MKKLLILLLILSVTQACKLKKRTLIEPIPVRPIQEIPLIEYNTDYSYINPVPIPEIIVKKNPKDYYWQALEELKKMLQGEQALSFKRAVFITENVFFNNTLSYEKFNAEISRLSNICLKYLEANPTSYTLEDKSKVDKNAALFHLMTNTIYTRLGEATTTINEPFTYDFEDFTGKKAWTRMFVTKLLVSHQGNCHSLPFLYKIIADEIGTDAYLSLAPNHIYLKHRTKQIGWYNTELTNGTFPIDAWIMTSGYITKEAIQNGIYMDTLSNLQSITLCLVDLAKSYERKFDEVDGFVLECANLAIHHNPLNINALLLKAETLKKRLNDFKSAYNVKDVKQIFDKPEAKETYKEMKKTYLNIYSLGYREMPENMYLSWLNSLKQEKEKFQNKKINTTLKTH